MSLHTGAAWWRRCGAMDQHGRQCRATKDVKLCRYHGSEDLYGFLSNSKFPGWVKVWLCPVHREE